MTGFAKDMNGYIKFAMREKNVVRVICGEREDANTRTRERLSNRTQDADFGKSQRAQDAEASKRPLRLYV